VTAAPDSSERRIERERKFLVAKLPDDLERCAAHAVEQGYVAIEPGGAEVRVRSTKGLRLLTVKGPPGRLTRREEEVELTAEQFERLWPLTEGRRVAKTRYELPLDGGLVVELDVFAGAHAGLTIAEVEFPDDEAAANFVPPEWFGREVTSDDAYANRRLASEGLPPLDVKGA
jgi:CYTH domain-containing protein